MALDRSPELKLAMEVMASVEYEMPIKGFSCFSSGSHFVEQNHFSNFCRESFKEHFYEIVLKLGHWPTSRCRYKVFFLFLALVASLCSRAQPF